MAARSYLHSDAEFRVQLSRPEPAGLPEHVDQAQANANLRRVYGTSTNAAPSEREPKRRARPTSAPNARLSSSDPKQQGHAGRGPHQPTSPGNTRESGGRRPHTSSGRPKSAGARRTNATTDRDSKVSDMGSIDAATSIDANSERQRR